MAAEKLFEKKVEKYLHSIGVYQAGTPSDKMDADQKGWFTKIWGGGYQKSGIPDLILCVNGIFLAVELKASVGHASDLQKMNTARINQSNGIGIILYPEGFEDFKNIMKGVIQCNVHIQGLNHMRNAHSSTKCVMLIKY
ncbi:MAG: VRR-NUC domain-containing protein [Candidatus Cloacimonetes bacterium]|nr:VRR-NUC domain-containing protein [Candidatus Cloacimonadota bacterium]